MSNFSLKLHIVRPSQTTKRNLQHLARLSGKVMTFSVASIGIRHFEYNPEELHDSRQNFSNHLFFIQITLTDLHLTKRIYCIIVTVNIDKIKYTTEFTGSYLVCVKIIHIKC